MRLIKENFGILVLIWTISFWSSFALAAEGQNCIYTNHITYNDNGDVIDSKQIYNCHTPIPEVVIETVTENVIALENNSSSSYNNNVQQNTSPAGDFVGLALLWGLLSAGQGNR